MLWVDQFAPISRVRLFLHNSRIPSSFGRVTTGGSLDTSEEARRCPKLVKRSDSGRQTQKVSQITRAERTVRLWEDCIAEDSSTGDECRGGGVSKWHESFVRGRCRFVVLGCTISSAESDNGVDARERVDGSGFHQLPLSGWNGRCARFTTGSRIWIGLDSILVCSRTARTQPQTSHPTRGSSQHLSLPDEARSPISAPPISRITSSDLPTRRHRQRGIRETRCRDGE